MNVDARMLSSARCRVISTRPSWEMGRILVRALSVLKASRSVRYTRCWFEFGHHAYVEMSAPQFQRSHNQALSHVSVDSEDSQLHGSCEVSIILPCYNCAPFV